jgi:spermidine/putrescine transport system permease protein
MYTRSYKSAVTIPPLLWVTAFLLIPYALLFCYSFRSVSPQQIIVHSWNLQNYIQLIRNPIYVSVLFRSIRIAAAVTLLALLLGYPLAYFLSFHAPKRKDLLYQLVIIPLWPVILCAVTLGKQSLEAMACSTASCNISTSRIIPSNSSSIARSR